jgi:hypothetical protein
MRCSAPVGLEQYCGFVLVIYSAVSLIAVLLAALYRSERHFASQKDREGSRSSVNVECIIHKYNHASLRARPLENSLVFLLPEQALIRQDAERPC